MNKKYYLWVLGCQMNKADSERVATILEDLGYQKTDAEDQADLIVTLACSVRQSAIDRIYGKTKIWNRLKKKKPITTILTGCILKADRFKMTKIFDHIFDINNLAKLPDLLGSDDLNRRLPNTDYFQIHPKYSNDFQTYVPTSNGCNNYCSYCVVPYVRGPEKSRPSKEIIEECKNLIDKGYKEITLLGQNVNSYGHDLKDDLTFPKLLQKICDLKGDFWLRFVTSHPKDMSDELIDVVAKNEKICNYIHLPVQSGDNKILKKMNRGYTREHYLKLIRKIRDKIPNVSISTDVIVGFPNETKKQFKNTVKLFEEVKFDMAYIAQYSPRPGTAAFKLKDDISKTEKQRREKILNNILKKTALKFNKNLVGQTIKVLVEEKKADYFLGKTKILKTVKFKANDDLIGQFIKSCPAPNPELAEGEWCRVKITKAQSFSLEGILVKSS